MPLDHLPDTLAMTIERSLRHPEAAVVMQAKSI